MFSNKQLTVLIFSLLIVCLCSLACKEKIKETGKLIITEQEFTLRQTHENSYVLDARGKIKNVGKVDVKKIVVTGYCRSCIETFTSQQWFISDLEKTANQKDTISYLTPGAEEEFSFEEVAFYFTHEKNPPEDRPEKIEIVIDSFEVVEN
jgi:hypothetical protein